jgi:hypothetical protein
MEGSVQGSTSHEFDWGGCRFTDESTVEEVQAIVVGERLFYYGQPGVAEAIRLVEGDAPWSGHPAPRPVYRVSWRADV